MRFLFEENQALSQLCEALRSRSAALFEGVIPAIQSAVWPVGTDGSSLLVPEGIMVLREGMLSVSLDSQDLMFLEEGDLISVAQLQEAGLLVKGEFAVIYDCFLFDQLQSQPRLMEQLVACLGIHQALLVRLVASLNRGERHSAPALRSLKKGEVIVTEGELSDRVFTLLEGHAEVISGGAVVGEVRPDELIGVIGALCGVPRIATVRATGDVLLMSLGKDEFVDLLSLRPHMIVKLISDFARIISTSNQALRNSVS